MKYRSTRICSSKIDAIQVRQDKERRRGYTRWHHCMLLQTCLEWGCQLTRKELQDPLFFLLLMKDQPPYLAAKTFFFSLTLFAVDNARGSPHPLGPNPIHTKDRPQSCLHRSSQGSASQLSRLLTIFCH